MSSLCILPTALSELFATSSKTGEITVADRYGIMAALLQPELEDEERDALNRLLQAMVRGRIRLVNQLSTFG